MTPDPRYSPAVLREDEPTIFEALGGAIAPGLATSLALYEERGGFRGPRCRPCIGRGCHSMSEANAPYCGRCRKAHEARAMAQAAGER